MKNILTFSLFKNTILKSNKAMTLLEIMIVLAIVALMASLIGPQVIGQLNSSKVKGVKIQISELSKTLDIFYTDCGFYPEELVALIEKPSNCENWGPDAYIKKIPKDAWGEEFIYELEDNKPIIISYGEDRREGGSKNASDLSSED